MALSKKNSRLITINSQVYRWAVSPNDGFNVLVVEKEGAKGQKTEVYFATDINNYWVDFPNIESHNLKALYPKEIASIIRKTLTKGWTPEIKGSPIVFDWQDGNIVRRERK